MQFLSFYYTSIFCELIDFLLITAIKKMNLPRYFCLLFVIRRFYHVRRIGYFHRLQGAVKADGVIRTAIRTFAAPYAFGVIGRNHGVDPHTALPGADVASDAFFTVNLQTNRRHAVEQGVKRTERTQVFAEWAE